MDCRSLPFYLNAFLVFLLSHLTPSFNFFYGKRVLISGDCNFEFLFILKGIKNFNGEKDAKGCCCIIFLVMQRHGDNLVY